MVIGFFDNISYEFTVKNLRLRLLGSLKISFLYGLSKDPSNIFRSQSDTSVYSWNFDVIVIRLFENMFPTDVLKTQVTFSDSIWKSCFLQKYASFWLFKDPNRPFRSILGMKIVRLKGNTHFFWRQSLQRLCGVTKKN